MVENGDILYSMIGTIGSVSFVLEKNEEYAIKNVALFKTSANYLLANFLYFHLKSPLVSNYIDQNLRGSTQNYVSLGCLREMPVFHSCDELLSFGEIAGRVINYAYCREKNVISLRSMLSVLYKKMSKA